MKKKSIMMSCIAAVALVVIVGKKTFQSHAFESSDLLMQNVEALSQPEHGGYKATTGPCPRPMEYKRWQTCTFGFGKEYTLTDCMNSDC